MLISQRSSHKGKGGVKGKSPKRKLNWRPGTTYLLYRIDKILSVRGAGNEKVAGKAPVTKAVPDDSVRCRAIKKKGKGGKERDRPKKRVLVFPGDKKGRPKLMKAEEEKLAGEDQSRR